MAEDDIERDKREKYVPPVYDTPWMNYAEMKFLLHELNLLKFEGAEHVSSAYLRYKAYKIVTSDLGKSDVGAEIHPILDKGIEESQLALKKASVATIDLLNANDKIEVFLFVNF